MAKAGKSKPKSKQSKCAKTKPADCEKISAAALCEITGLTDRRHRQLAQEGWFPPKEKDHWQRDATIRGLFRFFREGSKSAHESLAKKKEHNLQLKNEVLEQDRQLKEIALRNAKKQLRPAEDQAVDARKLYMTTRGELWARFIEKTPTICAGRDAVSIREVNLREINELLVAHQNFALNWRSPADGAEVPKELQLPILLPPAPPGEKSLPLPQAANTQPQTSSDDFSI